MSAKATKPVEETPDDITDITDLVDTDGDFSVVGTPKEPTRQKQKEPEVAETTDETTADEEAQASEESEVV